MTQDMERFYKESDLLFRRFNFFLLSIAFLVAAFVSVVTSDSRLPTSFVCLGHAVAALGSVLSAAFFVINYVTVKFINEIQSAGADDRIDPVGWMRHSYKDVINFMINPLKFSKELWASYTWFIPLLFLLFWIAAWWIVFSWIAPIALFLAMVVIALFYIFTGRYDWRVGKHKKR